MEFLELIKAAIIGIIEGLTEWLPISSTGHMILVDEFIQLQVSAEFWKMFLVVIQLGAICAVIILFFKKLNPFSSSKNADERRDTWRLWAKVIVGCIPAAIIGILLDDWFEEHFYNAVTVAVALVVYGIAFIAVERIKGEEKPVAVTADGARTGRHSPRALEARSSRGETITRPSSLQGVISSRQEREGNQDRQTGSSASRQENSETSRSVSSRSNRPASGRTSRQGSDRASRSRPASGRTSRQSGGRASRSRPASGRTSRQGGYRTSRQNKAGKTGGKGNNTILDVNQLGFGRALGIGVFQVLAIVPGTSRSGSTILGGRILGVSREAAAEFSFFLAIPVMFGWSLLKVLKGFVLDDLTLTSTEWGVLVVGIIVAFLVSILSIKFLMGYIRKHSFEVFGWYRIVLGIVILAFFASTSQLFLIQ